MGKSKRTQYNEKYHPNNLIELIGKLGDIDDFDTDNW